MTQAKAGDTVKVHYTGTLDDGSQFDSSQGRDPLEFTLGAGNVIPGFDQGVTGMSVGETKTIHIPADEAYGPRQDHLSQEVPRSAMPADLELEQGMVLQARNPDGQTLNFTVLEFNDETVKVDGNHPLAGKDLTFALELVAIG
jgi:FKBP-type peptidyl-prolyl cis-trans isomerase 2